MDGIDNDFFLRTGPSMMETESVSIGESSTKGMSLIMGVSAIVKTKGKRRVRKKVA